MIKVKRTWFGQKVARATLPVPEFTEQMVFRFRDQLSDYISSMNAADLKTLEQKTWRHFIARDIFLNVEHLSNHAPLLVLPETHFWIIDEDHMRVWVDEEVFRDFIRKFYPGTIDEAEIGVGLYSAYDSAFENEGDFPLSFNSMTLIIKRLDKPEKINAELNTSENPEPQPTPVESDALDAAICNVKKEYYLKREQPTSYVLTKIRDAAIAAALDGHRTEHLLKARCDHDTLKTRRVLQVSHAGHEENIEVEFFYSPDTITIQLPVSGMDGDAFDRLIDADGRTPSGVDQFSHADCKNMVMRKYYPNDCFTCQYPPRAVVNKLTTDWVIKLTAIKGKE